MTREATIQSPVRGKADVPATWLGSLLVAKRRSSAVVICRNLRHLVAILPLRPTRAQGVREVGGYRCRIWVEGDSFLLSVRTVGIMLPLSEVRPPLETRGPSVRM